MSDEKKLRRFIDKYGLESLYVHAGKHPATEQHDWVLLFVEIREYNSIESYGEVFTVVNDSAAVEVSSLDIVRDLKEDSEDDLLSPDLDAFLKYVDWKKLENQIDPPDIVNDAAFWDVPSFVAWFSERYPEVPGVITSDGLAVVWVESFVDNFVSVLDFDELDKVLSDYI